VASSMVSWGNLVRARKKKESRVRARADETEEGREVFDYLWVWGRRRELTPRETGKFGLAGTRG